MHVEEQRQESKALMERIYERKNIGGFRLPSFKRAYDVSVAVDKKNLRTVHKRMDL